jgi:biotin carboxylase
MEKLNKNKVTTSQSKKCVLFIGSAEGKLSHFMPAREMGYDIVLLKKKPSDFDKQYFDHIITADPFDTDSAVESVCEFQKKYRIEGCLTRFESYVPVAAKICKKLMLKGTSLKSAMNARDKLMMREALSKAGVPQPKFMRIRNISDLKKAASILGYPFLIKPLSGAKSRFIKKIVRPADIKPCFKIVSKGCKESSTTLFRNYSGIRSNNFKKEFIAEECITGKQVTTTSFISNGKITHIAVADLITAQDLGIDAFYLISRTTPSLLPDSIQKDICKISSDAIKALGLDNTPVHPELILTKEGPKILEVAARIGGYRTDMTIQAFGIKLNEIAIKIALGEQIIIDKKSSNGSTAVEVWPTCSGIIKEFQNLKQIENMKGVSEFVAKLHPGDKFNVPPIGQIPVATFLTSATTAAKSKKIADDVLKKLRIIFKDPAHEF